MRGLAREEISVSFVYVLSDSRWRSQHTTSRPVARERGGQRWKQDGESRVGLTKLKSKHHCDKKENTHRKHGGKLTPQSTTHCRRISTKRECEDKCVSIWQGKHACVSVCALFVNACESVGEVRGCEGEGYPTVSQRKSKTGREGDLLHVEKIGR